MSAFFSAAFRGLWRHRRLPDSASRADCARWLHQVCISGLAAMHAQLSVTGTPPTHGLIVSNHLSYLDILCYSAAVPCVFVSKAEVEQWPIFGKYARWSGSVFVHRHDRGDAARANLLVGESLKDGVPVVLFPEGTTTDGRRLLRFHATMLQPAIDVGAPITPCAISYQLDDGDPSSEVAWWGDMTLMPHVWNMMGKQSVRAKIVFGEPIIAHGDRKQLSHVFHEQVAALRDQAAAVAIR
ncbi:MAG TPA: lysophospholipid acyltransferase family protein [Verrucomicrobiae bacterium]|jgi:1-acyl-sn-glycerol-3-phosphate acyltransferase|nr:lysophospholipid acyltransferase family protein [Verrucomicrobiae bacterium]